MVGFSRSSNSNRSRRRRLAHARLCHDSRGELEQIQFLLGHASVQTTERYLGCKQNQGSPVNDRFNLRANVQMREKGHESAPANRINEPAARLSARRTGCARERPSGSVRGCALKALVIQLPEMEAAVKPSSQPRTKSCVMTGNGHCEA